MSKDNNSNSADKGGVNHAQANADTGANNAAGNVTFALAQSHFLVGDINTNTDKMRKLAIEAREQGAGVYLRPSHMLDIRPFLFVLSCCPTTTPTPN